MKFSIVTVTYNCKKCLEETVKSVIFQTYSDYEYIIIDAGSTDGTLNLITRYEKYISYWISEPDNGIYDGMNKAIKCAKGDYLIFMNAGDSFHDVNVLDNVSKNLSDDIDVVFGDYVSVTKSGNVYEHVIPFYENKSYLRQMGFCHQSVFVKTSLAKESPFDLSFNFCADYNMIYKLYQQGASFLQLRFPICFYNNSDGFTAKHPYKQTKEVARVIGIDTEILFNLLNICLLSKRVVKRLLNIFLPL